MNQTTLRLRCACGWESTGTFEELVAAAEEHGRRIHNMLPTREEIAAMVVPVEVTQPDPPAVHRTDVA
jgi:hypothetical protein